MVGRQNILQPILIQVFSTLTVISDNVFDIDIQIFLCLYCALSVQFNVFFCVQIYHTRVQENLMPGFALRPQILRKCISETWQPRITQTIKTLQRL